MTYDLSNVRKLRYSMPPIPEDGIPWWTPIREALDQCSQGIRAAWPHLQQAAAMIYAAQQADDRPRARLARRPNSHRGIRGRR